MALLEVLVRSDNDPDFTTEPIAVGSVVIMNPANNNGQRVSFPSVPVKWVDTASSIAWGFGIVVQVSPLIVVSEKADMRWTKLQASQLLNIGNASAAAMVVANTRLNS